MRALLIIALSLLAVALVPSSIAGQAPETDGVWYGVGVGYGMTMLNCGICTDQIRTGPSAQLKAGGKVSQSVLLGVETTGWMKRLEEVNQFVFSIHATGYLYAGGTPGLFLKGGVGPTWFNANEVDGDGDLGSMGWSIQFGIGYEARLNRTMTLSPYVNVVGSGFGELSIDDEVASDQFGVAQAQIGLSFTHY